MIKSWRPVGNLVAKKKIHQRLIYIFPVVAVGFVEKKKQFLDPSSISRPVAEEIWGMCLYLFTGQDVYLKLN